MFQKTCCWFVICHKWRYPASINSTEKISKYFGLDKSPHHDTLDNWLGPHAVIAQASWLMDVTFSQFLVSPNGIHYGDRSTEKCFPFIATLKETQWRARKCCSKTTWYHRHYWFNIIDCKIIGATSLVGSISWIPRIGASNCTSLLSFTMSLRVWDGLCEQLFLTLSLLLPSPLHAFSLFPQNPGSLSRPAWPHHMRPSQHHRHWTWFFTSETQFHMQWFKVIMKAATTQRAIRYALNSQVPEFPICITIHTLYVVFSYETKC